MPVKISWSAVSNFLACQRKYELANVNGLSRKPSVDSYALMQGSAFHAGLEAALKASFEGYSEPTTAAKHAAREYLKTATIRNKTKFNWDTRTEEHDSEYYAMMSELSQIVPVLLAYHVPLLQLGDKWRVPSKGEVLGYDQTLMDSGEKWYATNPELHEPAIEWQFEHILNADGDYLKGLVDTVLQDIETGEFVVVDWKTRKAFPYDSLALIDGQLHLYAGVLNEMGADITRVIMWQFKTKIPSKAELSQAKKTYMQPSTGRASYDTTWEVWAASLPKGVDPAKYEEEMRPKMKEDSDFQRPIEGRVTESSSSLMFDNVHAALASIKHSKTLETMPAALGSKACQYCDFARLCANGFRYGGDVTDILERDYVIRDGYGEVHTSE